MRELKVDFSQVLQKNWLGANAVYHGFAYQPDKEGRNGTPSSCLEGV